MQLAERSTMTAIPAVRDVADLAGIRDMQFVRVGPMLVRPNRTSDTVLVLFNGRLTDERVLRNDYFHRWSWHLSFRSTLVFCPDPLAGPATGLQLAWYVGTREEDVLGSVMAGVAAVRDAISPAATTHCFGSSAGGFAAAAALLRGLCDSSLVINPQTSVMAYHGDEPRRFAKVYGRCFDDLDEADTARLSLIGRLAVAERRPSARLYYYQNVHDAHHVTHHMLPFARAVDAIPPADSWLVLRPYGDRLAGHNPPKREGTIAMFRDSIPAALS